MYETIIIGSGPAGLMCATHLDNYLILEQNDNGAKKMLITGGGRCNVTNLKNKKMFLSELKNKDFLKPSVSLFGPREIVSFFENRNVPLKKEIDDKIFPVSNSSKDLVNALLKDVKIKYNERVLSVEKNDFFKVKTENGIFESKNLVIATGGMSYKNLGLNDIGYKIASYFGHKIVPIYPALVQVKSEDLKNLAGLSLDVLLFTNEKKFSGGIIITHKGISGPALFKISEHVKDYLFISFLPNTTREEFLREFLKFKQSCEVKTFLRNYFSDKLVNFLLEKIGIDGSLKLASISKLQRNSLFDTVFMCKVNVSSKGSLNEAIVTGGGVAVDFIDSKTMESKIIKGLYFVGELVDVHGPTGGYNISIALSTGNLAGISIASK